MEIVAIVVHNGGRAAQRRDWKFNQSATICTCTSLFFLEVFAIPNNCTDPQMWPLELVAVTLCRAFPVEWHRATHSNRRERLHPPNNSHSTISQDLLRDNRSPLYSTLAPLLSHSLSIISTLLYIFSLQADDDFGLSILILNASPKPKAAHSYRVRHARHMGGGHG
ncbi:hypothetical protein EJ04DRAFT_39299 [Polyplosphaeria fusca]|uniref:Uncharacterized protein n=1 Tax=Polyplosphaeria fusca TaxID=682080 RepID=A0A9P4QT99_9PLEO|nr:hypothetical protein EJ04DRAFT_39299 [Polyplosphaeria fusca]